MPDGSEGNKRGAEGRGPRGRIQSTLFSAQGQHRTWQRQVLCASEGSIFGPVSWGRKELSLWALSPLISLLLFVTGYQSTRTFLSPLSKVLLSKYSWCFPGITSVISVVSVFLTPPTTTGHWNVWWWFLDRQHWMMLLCVSPQPCIGAEFSWGLVEWPYLFVLAVWVAFPGDICLAGSLLFSQPHPIVALYRGTDGGPDCAKTFDCLTRSENGTGPRFSYWTGCPSQHEAWLNRRPVGL